MNILLIQYKMLGDVLTSTIIADQLKKEHPQARLDYVIATPAVALVQEHPAIDAVIAVGKQEMETLGGLITLSRKLSKNNYQLLIDVYGKNNSALLALFTRSKQKIGYKKWFASFVYSKSIVNKPDFKIDFQGTSLWSRLVLTTLINIEPDWSLQPKIYLTTTERETGKSWVKSCGIDLFKPLTMIGALGSEDLKTLPAQTMAQLIDRLVATTGSQVLFNYMPSQKEKALAIYNLCTPATQHYIFIDHYPSGIRDFLKVLSHCNAFIGNEGGALNMAKALDIPSFSIYSPWIVKGAWNAGVHGTKHMAVHLQDYKPQLFETGSYKNRKKTAVALYEQFTAAMIAPQLDLFLKGNF